MFNGCSSIYLAGFYCSLLLFIIVFLMFLLLPLVIREDPNKISMRHFLDIVHGGSATFGSPRHIVPVTASCS